VNEVVLGVNYLADMLRNEVGSNYNGIEIKYSSEKTPLGTAGPIKLASEATRFEETFFAMNGDVIANIDLEMMLTQHRRSKALVTDALYEVKDPTRFGVVQLDKERHIKRFVEKPTAKEAPSRLVNAGIYVMEPEVLGMIPKNRKVSLEREIFPVLAKDEKLGGYPFEGDWFDIGSLTDYREANFSLLAKHVKERSLHDRGVQVEKGAIVRPPVILGEGSKVGNGVTVGPQLIGGKGILFGERALVSNSILFDDVTIGEGAIVAGSILASGVSVGKEARIETGSIVSPSVKIGDGVRIGRNAIIHPHKEIESNIRPGSHVM
jgi:mannose-1-phosphate guanylyltransferase